MADWRAIHTTIPQSVKEVLGRKFDVGWNNRESRWRDDVHCRVSVIRQTLLGQSENRLTDNGDGTFTERSYRPSRLELQFMFVSQCQNLWESALPPAEAYAGALQRSDVRDTLCEASLGVASVGDIRVSDFLDQHKRWRSAALFQVTFNTHSSIVTGFGKTGDYVEEVEFEGNVDGRLLPCDRI